MLEVYITDPQHSRILIWSINLLCVSND